MFDLLSALYHDEPLFCRFSCDLEAPRTAEERGVAAKLQALGPEAAQALTEGVRTLTNTQSEKAFYCGVRIGAQLMAQLLEDLPT